MVAVRWYLRYGLSYRDVEQSLAERGTRVDHVMRAVDLVSVMVGPAPRHSTQMRR
jgi:transposase-like protein